ncbi:uncharacterized protein BDW70DRAFT_8570 [Aspergillus foveolatus]|uniref:uncharacterized protein n=1 Tax=Aspergillus foveolatus TaxID=210207 RepID=UPI003CCDCE2D
MALVTWLSLPPTVQAPAVIEAEGGPCFWLSHAWLHELYTSYHSPSSIIHLVITIEPLIFDIVFLESRLFSCYASLASTVSRPGF